MYRRLRHNTSLIRLVQGVLPLLGLVVAIYAATQSPEAPLIILYILLDVILINFSLSLPYGRAGFLSALAVSSLLIVGFQPALLALLIGLLLTELMRPIWQPLDPTPYTSRLATRLGLGLIVFVALTAANGVYRQWGGTLPIDRELIGLVAIDLLDSQLPSLIGLAASYLGVHGVLYALLSLLDSAANGRLESRHWLTWLLIESLALPLALLGVLIYFNVGLPAFIMFSVGLAGLAITIWLSWYSRTLTHRQVEQFTALNQSGQLLRETLDLPQLLTHIYEQINQLIPADAFMIILQDENGRWVQSFVKDPRPAEVADSYELDDLTRWVIDHQRVLDLDTDNMHYAPRHGLQLPQPRPDVWLGVPLTTHARTVGALVIQRYPPAQPLSRWGRELMLAFAQQAGSAIQNAQLYGETVRLYNLTDEALARRVEQLQALLNSTHEGVLMVDLDGRVVLVNPLAVAWLDDPPIGQLLDDRALARLDYPPAAWSALLGRLQAAHRPPVQHTIYALEQRFVERTETAVLAENGRVMGWLIILRDVTEAHQQAQWRTHFTHMIVHDLRNPVTTLMSSLRLLEAKVAGEGEDESAQLVRNGQRVGRQMLDMVDSLMNINQLEAGQLIVEAEAMRVPPLVERVAADLLPLAEEKQITLSTEHTADLPAAWADEELVRRIVVNLLDNALKFTPAGGRVEVWLTAEPAANPATHEKGVRCAIRDTGVGIPAEYHQQIFERFVRIGAGGAQIRGTGIGLSFCQLAVTAQNGRIWIEDAADMGSCFVFTLPGIPHFEDAPRATSPN